MAKLPGAFQADDHGDMGTFEPLPAGDVNLKVVDSDVKLTKKAEEAKDPTLGQYVQFDMEVMDGDHKGRKYTARMNIVNSNPTAEELGQKELATFCRAIGVPALKDTADAHGKYLTAEMKQTGKETDQYGIQNTVKTYKKYTGPIEKGASAGAGSGAKTESAPKKRW